LQLVHKEILLAIGKRQQIRKPVDSVLSIIDKTENEYTQTEFCEPAPVVEPEKHNTRDTIAKNLNWSTGKVALT
jgi:hypothetical protein